MTDRSRQERPPAAAGDSVARDPVSAAQTSVDRDVPEGAASEGEDRPSTPDTAQAAASRRRRAGATGVVRGSAATVARGSAAATREGVALAARASRVTYWPAQLCVLAAILLQVGLSHQLTAGPRWLLPSLEGALLIGLAVTTPRGRVDVDHPVRRRVAIGLIALVNVANAISLYLLAHELLHKHVSNGHALILSGIAIWLTNVLIFALWYWQLDRGGPANRARHPDPHTPEGRPDFVFSAMDSGQPYLPDDWTPEFLDYLALAVNTATAFSPTDTMPISRAAKTLMSTQALISLITLGLIISRAVGILG
jgi:hypothetical protein